MKSSKKTGERPSLARDAPLRRLEIPKSAIFTQPSKEGPGRDHQWDSGDFAVGFNGIYGDFISFLYV
jgi:hypothetical protein